MVVASECVSHDMSGGRDAVELEYDSKYDSSALIAIIIICIVLFVVFIGVLVTSVFALRFSDN